MTDFLLLLLNYHFEGEKNMKYVTSIICKYSFSKAYFEYLKYTASAFKKYIFHNGITLRQSGAFWKADGHYCNEVFMRCQRLDLLETKHGITIHSHTFRRILALFHWEKCAKMHFL